MGVPERPQETKNQLIKLFDAIERGRLEDAKLLLNDMGRTIGRDPDLVKADILIRRKEVLGT